MTLVAADIEEDEAWHRLSPRMLLIHPVVEIIRALPALVGVVLAGTANGHGGKWGLIAAGVVAAFSLTRWLTVRFRITPERVQVRHGLLRRKTIATTRDRIRTVDVTSHLLHRVLGLARVVIGTGTSDRKSTGRIVLDGLTVQTADQLREDLLHRTTPAAGADPAAASPDEVRELARLDRAWIRYAPFTLSGVITGFVLWGFYWRVQGESGVDLMHTGPFRAVGRTLDRMPTTAAVLLVITAVVVFVAVTSTAGYILAFWNFRLCRHDGGTLQVSRGLITTRATSIERRRLVGAQLSEPLLLRAVGAARVSAIATGLRTGRGAERGGEVLLPPAPRSDAEAVAALALDGTPAITVALTGHSLAARRRRIVRATTSGFLLLALSVAAWRLGAPAWVPIVGLVVLAASIPLGLDRYRNLGHTIDDGYLVTRFGSLVRRRSVIECGAVIGWNLRTTFFQRRLGLTTLTATTAAGRQGYRVWDLEAPVALVLADAATPDLLRQFRPGPRAGSPTGHPATSS